MSIGLVMVYSASIAFAESEKIAGYRTTYFLMRHAVYPHAGHHGWLDRVSSADGDLAKYAPILFTLCCVLLLIVLIPGIGKVINGSRRWLSLGPLTIAAIRIDETLCRAVRG